MGNLAQPVATQS